MTPERYARIRQVLSWRQPDLTVITDGVHKTQNLSAVIRTCDAAGVDEIHCVRPDTGFRTHRGTMGSHKWVNTRLYDDIGTPVTQLKERGFHVVAAHLSDKAVDFKSFDYTQPTAVLLGGELEGVSDEADRLVDSHVIIPIMGMVESFNVSVACALILMEAQRQRWEKGLYDENQPRLPKERFDYLMFRGCQPVVARYCDMRGLEYPPLDDEGEIVDGVGWSRRVGAR
ncbi:tRNA (guanosine(18)-2'-O)-methyltransferase TrmH [Biformimicrobium ophioploci]|uniref:tRNA (guanosine(18)-2'-O)-methyltransferase n=1 Tax=Biformimicrobium ophioploci TaxID=3036711 RepID=A0ABQ6M1M7_9GAMM|nr:tRNA (guanosine(18)-2'-O)-methyltransferase TrmH [Microbulbifer sp. NKW57]GMG88251.1 tRNA (guanosine(18)-2'-O)-methyltransferase TrmH [Microbulbifer sp. NKW57]